MHCSFIQQDRDKSYYVFHLDEKCRKFTLAAPFSKDLVDTDKNPAVITRMDLVKEVKGGKCSRGVNFDFNDSTLRVRGTCKGVFEVCILPGTPSPLTTAPPTPRKYLLLWKHCK